MMFKSFFQKMTFHMLLVCLCVQLFTKHVYAQDASIASDPHGKLYLAINDVSPFGRYEEYKQAANYLNSQGLPFIMTLFPLYLNTDLPEAREFMSVIRYMQSKGGTAVLRSFAGGEINFETAPTGPLLPDEVNLYDRISRALKIYTDKGIYPLAFYAPQNLITSSAYCDAAKGFSTLIYKDTSKLPPEIDSASGINSLKELTSLLKIEGIQLTNLLEENNIVKLGETILTSEKGKLISNGTRVSLKNWERAGIAENAFKAVPEKRELKTNVQIQKANRFMVIVVTAFCLILLFVFITGKRIDKRKFLR